ncbi:MAG: DEAD/DEAH box helicase, partial [Actinomycetota bacterium]
LEKLSSDMPAVCRCLNNDTEAPDMPAGSIVNTLLARCIDAIIRSANPMADKSKKHDSLHDVWTAALTAKNAQVMWSDEQEIYSFSKQLSDWSRPVDLITYSPFKLCFRLSEPFEDEDKWRLDYLLQPKDDQSLSLPVADLWGQNPKLLKQLQKYKGSLIEFILIALGQASGLCPYIAESLKEKNPGGFDLNSYGALTFLKEYSEDLRASDFIVLLPSWWVGRGTTKRLGLKVKARSPQMQGGEGILTLNTMIKFDYAVSLGSEEISLEELKFLANLKAPLVKLRGQWTQISQQQIRSAILLLEKHKNQASPARELLAIALGESKQVEGLPVDAVETQGWLGELLEKLTGRAEFGTLSQPSGFKGKLRLYQNRGFSWLAFLRQWGLGACLADDMGLGKTVQTLALLQKEITSGETRPVLVVCPTTVINNWRKEAQFFTPELKVMVHHGIDRQKKEAFKKAAADHAIVISSYGLLQRDISFLKEVRWAGVILDEAQNIKNPETAQSKAARSLSSDYRIALTGTPVENHIGDIWSLMEFLNPGLLGNRNSFKNNFYKPIQAYRNPDALNKLKALTGPFILRRLKTDKSIISDLPEKMEMKDYCTLTKEQASLYKAVVDDMLNQVEQSEGINRRGLVLATLMKLKQVCNHPAQFAKDNSSIADRSGKLQRLKDMLLETRESKERTLIFTQFAEMGRILSQYFQDLFAEEVFLLHGGTSKKNRDEMVERFQNDENAPLIFILSLKAGGTGLTLTRANNVIHYDRWWNPAVENQATDRAFRIGQTKNVQVHKFIVAGTLEERIDEMIEKKTGLANQVVDSGEQWLSELSNEDFSKLIRLGSEALGE